MGDRATKILDGLTAWLGQNNTAVMAVLCMVIAVKLIADAITGLSA